MVGIGSPVAGQLNVIGFVSFCSKSVTSSVISAWTTHVNIIYKYVYKISCDLFG